MPATPRFKVSQTDLAVVVCIKVPHIRVGSAETHVDGTEFSFYCKPYLLRLTLPYEVGGEDDDGSCKAVYDPSDENGTITVTLKKVIPGQHFPDLDLTTTLMQPRWTPKDLLKEGPSGADEGGAEGGVRASSFSGVEVVSSERYDIHDDGDDESAANNGSASCSGADGGGGSRLPGGGAGVAGTGAGAAAADGRRAGGGGGGVGAKVLIRPPSYGFNDKFSGFFTSLREELREMIHLPDPDKTPVEARRGLRIEHEQAAFDPDRYLGDLFTEEEDPLLTEALAFEPHWRLRLRAQERHRRRRQRRRGHAQEEAERNSNEEEDKRQRVEGGGGASQGGGGGRDGAPEDGALLQGVDGIVTAEDRGDGGQDEEEEGFTEAEQEQMRRLPNREYLIETGSAEERRVLLGLADILFAYAYDHRTTTGDATVESPWTVAVLSPLLSWLEAPAEGGDVAESSPVTPDAFAETDVALAGIRRSLIFPYLRVWELGALVARDVRDILAAGKRCILRCLLQTYALMERGEVHYLLNKLFIEDYCVWIQKASEKSLAALAERYAAAAASITKSGACLDLERIEVDAERMIAAGEGGSEDEEESSTEEESSDEEEEDCSDESSEESSGESSDEESSADEDNEGGGGEEKKAEARSGGDEASGGGIGRTPATPSTQAHSSEALASPVAAHDASAAAAAAAADTDATALSNEAANSGASGAAATAGGKASGSSINISDGRGGERDPQRSTTTAVAPGRTGTDDDDASEPSASRAVEGNTDLLQLESLADKASRGSVTSSSALASKLSGLSLGEHGAPILPGGCVGVGKAVVGSPPPPPPRSSEAVGSSAGDGGGGGGGEGKGRRKKLIEEL